MKPTSLISLALAGGFFTTSAIWEALFSHYKIFNTKLGLKFLEWKKKNHKKLLETYIGEF